MDKFKEYLLLNKEALGEDVPSQKVWNTISKNIPSANQNLDDFNATATPKKGLLFSIAKWTAAACIFALAGIGGWHLLSSKNIIEPTIAQNNITPNINATNTNIESAINIDIDTPFNKINLVSGIETNVVKLVEPKKHKPTPNPTYTSPLTVTQQQEINNIENNFNSVITLAKNKIANTPIYGENASFYSDFIDKFKQMENDEKVVKKEIVQFGLNDMLLEQLINIYQQKLNVLKLLQSEIHKTNIRFKQYRNAVDTLKASYLEI